MPVQKKSLTVAYSSDHTILIHSQIVSISVQAIESSQAINVSGTPHNTLVVYYVTIHHKSNLIITFQFLVGSAVIVNILQC